MKNFKLLIILILISINLIAQSEYDNYFRAIAAKDNSQFEEAIIHFNNAILLNNNDFSIYIERAKVFYEMKKYNYAILDYKQAEKINKKIGLLELSKCYAIKNMIDSSLFYLEKYLKLYDKIPKSEIKLDDDFENINNLKKWNVLWEKDWYSPIEITINKAIYHKNQKEYIESLWELNSVLKINKRYHKAYFLKGEIFAEVGNYKDAIKNYSKAIKLKPKNPTYLIARAEIYAKAKKYKKAKEDYNISIQQNPKNIHLYYKRALILNELKQYQAALNDMDTYFKYYNNSEVNYFYGIILYNSEDYINSLKYFNLAIEKDNSVVKYYYARANAYLKTRTFEYAIEDYNTVLDRSPKNTEIYLLLGITKLEQNDKESACMYWQKSIDNKDYRANNYIIKHCKPNSKKK